MTINKMAEQEIETALFDENSEASRQVEKLLLNYVNDIAAGKDASEVLLVRSTDTVIAKVAKRILSEAEN